LDKIIKLHRILLLLAHWIKLQIYFCVTPLENAPRRHDKQFENHVSTGCELLHHHGVTTTASHGDDTTTVTQRWHNVTRRRRNDGVASPRRHNDAPRRYDEQFENHGSTGCKLCSTGVIAIQYLLLTFRECMQTLFLSK